MATTLHAKLGCIVFAVQKSSTLSKHQRKWHSAFVTIYCSRAFNLSSLLKPKFTNTKIPRSPSYATLTVKPDNEFEIHQTTLIDLVKEKSLKQLRELGGVEEIASALKTDADHGILGNGDAQDIAKRVEAFGSNTYMKPPAKGFFHFVWEAFKDLTIIILLGCAALSLGLGIKVHGLKEGWIDGGSIFLAIILVLSVSAVSNYRQNRQFVKLSKVSDNVQIEAVRGGRRQQISIFDIVVGDVICLKIGDQVPADGLFLDGHSLQVDESSMTGESDHVE
ncbi:putative calcium-transporting ATPase 13 plasma membrane-type [Prunus yedoensis var. nudiflora]|uniref:Putative calcium-transporting ATPase 13 plasma membrane-type n=1 Tax=Prunus yedoensis var. nudiflora TaxID=2094558 RepID=A0A314XP29_PRUYE|nr:putative calcium-transporting ATPase 13 plasma membrane-type [Prunus yedoensis var. nudiflora]